MKIFATFISDGDGYPSIFRIGLNSEAFPKDKFNGAYSTESDIYFQEINPDTEVTNYEDDAWMPYNGKIAVDHGWMINNRFISEYNDEWPEEGSEYENLDDHGPRVIKYEIYEKGELVDVKFIEEEW